MNPSTKKCIPCEARKKALSKPEIEKCIKELDEWNLLEDPATGDKIEKNYIFKDFKRALTFINEVGDVAEYEGHHPNLSLHDWNQVCVTLYTHAIKGLSENDIIMAAKIDRVITDSAEK